MKQIIGLLLLASPFISIAVMCFMYGGWRAFVFTFGITGLILLVVSGGLLLLVS